MHAEESKDLDAAPLFLFKFLAMNLTLKYSHDEYDVSPKSPRDGPNQIVKYPSSFALLPCRVSRARTILGTRQCMCITGIRALKLMCDCSHLMDHGGQIDR